MDRSYPMRHRLALIVLSLPAWAGCVIDPAQITLTIAITKHVSHHQ